MDDYMKDLISTRNSLQVDIASWTKYKNIVHQKHLKQMRDMAAMEKAEEKHIKRIKSRLKAVEEAIIKAKGGTISSSSLKKLRQELAFEQRTLAVAEANLHGNSKVVSLEKSKLRRAA